MFKMKEKTKKSLKPKLITLTKYDIVFVTIDGEEHRFSYMAYCDESKINCSAGDFFMCGENYLEDDDGVHYPMTSVVSYKFELSDKIENVKDTKCKIWYKTSDIKEMT